MPSTALRQSRLPAAQRVVVKVGTQLLTKPAAGSTRGVELDARYLGRLASQVVALRERGVQVTLVSSGAVGAGCVELGLDQRPADVATLQAIAALGQRRLMQQWHDTFKRRGVRVAQVLLSRTDFDERERYLNLRNTVAALHTLDVLPILNENDTVAVDEIRFGDNDQLAALACTALHADALVLLTVVDGLLDDQGAVVDLVDNVMERLSLAKRDAAALAGTSAWGSGGMRSKLEAARTVTDAGEVALVANGRAKDILPRLLAGEKLGTAFTPAPRKLGGRSRWISHAARPTGTVTVDAGAAEAITDRGKSLLPSGVTALTGAFARGDVLLIRDPRGHEVARGLTNYAAQELRLIAGKRSDTFAEILGHAAYTELVHRDHLVLRQNPAPR